MNEIRSAAGRRGLGQEIPDILIGLQVGGNIKRLDVCVHGSILLIEKFTGLFDIFALRGFVATDQQQNNAITLNRVIDAQTCAKEKTQLKQIAIDCLEITKIAVTYAVEPGKHLVSCLTVFQPIDPLVENAGAGQFVTHTRVYPSRYIKASSGKAMPRNLPSHSSSSPFVLV
jgi:hypothetical protein